VPGGRKQNPVDTAAAFVVALENRGLTVGLPRTLPERGIREVPPQRHEGGVTPGRRAAPDRIDQDRIVEIKIGRSERRGDVVLGPGRFVPLSHPLTPRIVAHLEPGPPYGVVSF
jgi:hypothetical protein